MAGSQSPQFPSFWRWLGCIALLALGIRLVPLLASWQQPTVFLNGDSHGYHRLAVNLLAGNGYCWEERPPYMPNVGDN